MAVVRARVAVLASGATVLLAVSAVVLGSALRWVPWPTPPLPTAVERLLTIDPLLDPGRFGATAAASARTPLGDLRRALRAGGFDDGARGGIPRLFVATRSAGAARSDRADRSRRRRGGVRGRDRDRGASTRPGTPLSVEEAAEDDPDERGNGRGDGGDDDGGGSPSGGGGGSAVSNGGDADGNGDGEPNAGDGTGGNGRGDGNAGKGKGKDGNSGNGGNADDDDGGAAGPSPARSRGGGQDDDD